MNCSNESAKYLTRFNMEIFEGVLSSHIFPWHYHDRYTVIFIEMGSMKYIYHGKELTVKANQIHIVNPFVSHYNFPLTTCEYKAIFLPLNIFNDYGNHNSIIHFEEVVKEDKRFFDKLKSILNRAKIATSEKSIERIQSEISQLLFLNFSFFENPLLVDKRIIPAIEFINKNLDKKLLIKEIADKCFLSPYHFQRLFKKAIGLTIKDFIQQQKTELGKELIRNGYHLSNTAFEVGFYDQSHFNKTFKKMWAAKPADFK